MRIARFSSPLQPILVTCAIRREKVLRSKRPEVRVLSGVPTSTSRLSRADLAPARSRIRVRARGILYVRLQAWQVRSLSRAWPTSLLEAARLVFPAIRPCSGCRLPPVVRLRPNRRPCCPSGCPGGSCVVFRRDSKVDAFQRQISALRHQLGGENEDGIAPDRDRPRSVDNEQPLSLGVSGVQLYPNRPDLVLTWPRRYAGPKTGRIGATTDTGDRHANERDRSFNGVEGRSRVKRLPARPWSR